MSAPLGGWATGPWGLAPWGGFQGTPGGALPFDAPFDIFCLMGGQILEMFSYPDVTYTGDPGNIALDTVAADVQIGSGGTFPPTGVEVDFTVPVPESFTLEVTLRLNDLPLDFTDPSNRYVYIGAADAAGACFGLLFSQIGILYTGAAHVVADALVFDSALQPLPNSQVLIDLAAQTTLRVACDYEAQTTYIYLTPTADLPAIGHQLRYVLPGFVSANQVQVPPDGVTFKVNGTTSAPSIVTLDSVCLGTGLLIPTLPPRADAGNDQAVRTCSIARLDGARSYDLQGAPLTYLWQLVDVPLGSKFAFASLDGDTEPLPVPTGFTDKLYSVALGDEDALDPFDAGDVLILAGQSYTIAEIGADMDGSFVRVVGYELPETLPAGTPFQVVRQRGVSGATTVTPTFYPDVPGIYKFKLVVGNNVLLSSPSETILNVTESSLPKGITPDLRFLWEYLSDFWRLVEDRERIEVFWGALAQVAAAELLNLWQTDYSKSLRDIQRTVQRKWLHYDLAVTQSKTRAEDTRLRAIYGGLSSPAIPAAGTMAAVGTALVLRIPGDATPLTVPFLGAGPHTAQDIADRLNTFLPLLDPRLIARVHPRRDLTAALVRIDAPYAVTVDETSTCSLFTGSNGRPQGTAGAPVAPRIYRVERPLSSLVAVSSDASAPTGLTEGDYLVVGEGSYRIARAVDDPLDPWRFQRLTLLDDIPATAGPVWAISGQAFSPDLDFFSALATAGDVATVEVVDATTLSASFGQVLVLGASPVTPGRLAVDASVLGQYLADPARYTVFFSKLTRRTYVPIPSLVQDVPYLQETIKVKDGEAVLRRNVDYVLGTYRDLTCFKFVTSTTPTADVWEGLVPPDRLWAEMSYLDNRPTIEGNFGIPAAFTLDDLSLLPSNVDYLSAVRGLWFAYFNGPTIFNLRAGSQILLGLPFAEEAGTIEELRDDFSTTTGRILVRDTANPEIVRSYSYPHALSPEINPSTKLPYKVGDAVAQFAPLVQGVEVLDYVKSPTWFAGYLGQGAFLEVEKFFKFLVRVDSVAFNLSALLFVQSFLRRIKPTYTYPLFVVQAGVATATVSVDDVVHTKGILSLYEGPNFAQPQAGMWDDPRSGGGGYWSQYDEQYNYNPTFPTPTAPVSWGFDQPTVFPKYGIAAVQRTAHPGGEIVFDSVFAFDTPETAEPFVMLADHFVTVVGPLASDPYVVAEAIPATQTGTATAIYLEIGGQDALSHSYSLRILQNGTPVGTFGFTKAANTREAFVFTTSLPITTGDMIEARIGTSSGDIYVEWHDLVVVLTAGSQWSFDTPLPAGDYTQFRSL